MKTLINRITQGLLLMPALVLGLSLVAPVTVGAQNDCNSEDLTVTSGADCAQGDDTPVSLFDDEGVFRQVVEILLFLVGAVAVIMLIIGGIRYVVSNGDQNNVTAAKNTILYAIIGIIVAILAYAIVDFVANSLSEN